MMILRLDHEPPHAIAKWGWKYHHIGIPTSISMPDEKYLPLLKFYHSGFSISPFGVEWIRFEEDSPVHELVQKVPHIAFEVADLEYELRSHNFTVIIEPNSPSELVRVAMIEDNSAPIELIEFSRKLLP